MKDAGRIIEQLKAVGDPRAAAGMARYGINAERALGVRIPVLRRMAKEIGKDQRLAGQLWESGVHEGRILAGMIARPEEVTEAFMEDWVQAFDSWDVCDGACMNLFRWTEHAWDKAVEWSGRDEEFVKRAGFAMMACLATGDKKAADARFEPFFECIVRECSDGRNYVKKAINWALRQIGKRNAALNKRAIEVAETVARTGSGSARWIASDAIRELRSEGVRTRLGMV